MIPTRFRIELTEINKTTIRILIELETGINTEVENQSSNKNPG